MPLCAGSSAPVTRFLASVRDDAEAGIVLAAGADIIDLKEPAEGALGAVPPETVRTCVARIAGRKPVSATVGDLPMVPRLVSQAVAATASLGVDDVKLGVPPGGDPDGCFEMLTQSNHGAGLILVFFADAMPDCDPVGAAKAAGARGVMLDTAEKAAGTLTDHISIDTIARFVAAGRRAGLMVGLAGSLRASHLKPLLALEPDVIGVRGALCRQGDRSHGLDPAACRRIRSLIRREEGVPEDGFGERGAASVC